MKLRPYQFTAVQDLRESYRTGHKSPLLVMPTGAGKTATFSFIGDGASKRGKRVMILVHRKELLIQASCALAKVGLRHTLISPSKNIKEAMSLHIEEHADTFIDLSSRVAVASVDTLIRRFDTTLPPDFLIFDEAHHVWGENKWGKVAKEYMHRATMLGVTATPMRGDGKGLGIHAGGYFDDIILGPTPQTLINEGYLKRPVVYAPPQVADLSGVATKGGDYDQQQLAIAMDKPTITGDAVKHYAKICPHWPAIAFCVNIEHAKHVAAEFRASGFDFRAIDGTMGDYERRTLIRMLATGKIDGLTSCDIIAEGTDIPLVACGIFLRPTKSEGLYMQQGGRTLRPIYADGHRIETIDDRLMAIRMSAYPYSVILDHVGNCLLHGLLEADREYTLDGATKKKRGQKDEPTVKLQQCPKCYHAHEPDDQCPMCGHLYEFTGRKLEAVEGELTEVTGEVADLLRNRMKKEVGRARTLDELKEIAKQRGYKPAWAEHVFKARMRRSA